MFLRNGKEAAGYVKLLTGKAGLISRNVIVNYEVLDKHKLVEIIICSFSVNNVCSRKTNVLF